MIDLEKVPVDLRKHAQKAAFSLSKLDLDGTPVAVYLVLDHSGSMSPYYRSGAVNRLTNQILALSTRVDDDGEVPVFYFGTRVSPPVTVELGQHDGFVSRTHGDVHWGLTNYADTIYAVADYHRQHGGGNPGLVVFQTDGSPYTGPGGNARSRTTQALRDVSGDDLFFAFVGFGPREQVEFLFQLDQITGRERDNASAFHVENPESTTDLALYDGILGEFGRDWLPQVKS